MDHNNDNIIYPEIHAIIQQYVEQFNNFKEELNKYSIDHSTLETIFNLYIKDEDHIRQILSSHTNSYDQLPDDLESHSSDDEYTNKDLEIIPNASDDVNNSICPENNVSSENIEPSLLEQTSPVPSPVSSVGNDQEVDQVLSENSVVVPSDLEQTSPEVVVDQPQNQDLGVLQEDQGHVAPISDLVSQVNEDDASITLAGVAETNIETE